MCFRGMSRLTLKMIFLFLRLKAVSQARTAATAKGLPALIGECVLKRKDFLRRESYRIFCIEEKMEIGLRIRQAGEARANRSRF